MLSFSKKEFQILPLLLLLAFMFQCLVACANSNDKNSGDKEIHEGNMTELSQKLSSMNSASRYLTIEDLDKFRPGRSKRDILKDVQWRGYFRMASEHEGKIVSAIVYDVFSDAPNAGGGLSIWAMFIDDLFTKFVKPPPTLPEDTVVIDAKRSVPKPLKAGDNRFLIRALDGEPLDVAYIKKEVQATAAPPPRHIDPGLTAAYFIMRSLGLAPGPGDPPTKEDYLRNAALRDQFNAARLNIGMTEAEVEAVLKATPLESGEVEAGSYRIFGSNEAFNININSLLHFSNILIIFREGKAVSISSIPAGYDWRRNLGKRVVDLPETGD